MVLERQMPFQPKNAEKVTEKKKLSLTRFSQEYCYIYLAFIVRVNNKRLKRRPTYFPRIICYPAVSVSFLVRTKSAMLPSKGMN